MQTDLRYQPAFTTLFATLSSGDTITAEADAMASMSANTTIKTRWNGGFIGGILRRLFGGESMFVNEFSSADGEDAEVVLTQACPGDMMCVELNNTALYLTKGSFIAMGSGVKLGLRWAGIRSWFAGEGCFDCGSAVTGRSGWVAMGPVSNVTSKIPTLLIARTSWPTNQPYR